MENTRCSDLPNNLTLTEYCFLKPMIPQSFLYKLDLNLFLAKNL